MHSNVILALAVLVAIIKTPYKKLHPSSGAYVKFTILDEGCQSFLKAFLNFFYFFQKFFMILYNIVGVSANT